MLKTIFKISFAILIVVACQQNRNKEDLVNLPVDENGNIDTVGLPKLIFLDANNEHDFGRVTEGTQVSHVFKIKNIGKSPLLISNVETSCGCTVPKNWPTQPLKTGETGEIEVNFDTEGRANKAIKKSVKVYANTYPTINYAYIVGEVVGIED